MTLELTKPSFFPHNNMADDNSNVPPRPSEAPKVAPKKETVRISLPPKPTASPTIKLPAMPAGGAPSTAKAAPAAAAPAAAAPTAKAPSAPAPPVPPKGGANMKVAPAPSGPPSAGPRPAMAPRPSSSGGSTSVLDSVLAIVAMIVSLAAVGSMYMLFTSITANPY